MVTLPANLEPTNSNSTRESLSIGPSISTRQYDASSEGQQIGLLRVVTEEGTRIPQYIWWDYAVEKITGSKASNIYSFPKILTMNRHEALVVSFLPSSSPHQIGCLNSRGNLKKLVISWRDSPAWYYALHGCTNNTPVIKQDPVSAGFVSKLWSFLADGTLQASLSSFSLNNQRQYEETKFTTTEVHMDTSGENIRFVKPGASLEQDQPQGSPVHPFVRARIVFEPL
ncbi:hypothetical protein M407DRAFT_31428 [Tulasnella calospora MUT 4182]|uniref:Uncharacterized protein n=1 Tax=Tulasnella calospora MUT 4182 TaxID=1051891 RepID=A0A0C3PVF1_9AGAM|nr:hypothetical protein M407DRAFT_31428 [Tulasnella calospora MUT 4182]